MKKTVLILSISLCVTHFVKAQKKVIKAEANLIYNFTKFFDWPQQEKTGDFIIGIFGSKDLYRELKNITEDKKNVTQNIVIKHFEKIGAVSKCHVIFVNSLKSNHLTNIYKKTSVHCLIISNSISAIEKGAAIQFFIEDDLLKYDFSQENALKHGLKFHSKVSEMASRTYY